MDRVAPPSQSRQVPGQRTDEELKVQADSEKTTLASQPPLGSKVTPEELEASEGTRSTSMCSISCTGTGVTKNTHGVQGCMGTGHQCDTEDPNNTSTTMS